MPDGVILGASSGVKPGVVHHHSLLLPGPLRPPINSHLRTGEVVEPVRDPVLEAVLEVGDAPSRPSGAGSPSRSLPLLAAREQAAPSPVPEPAPLGGRVSLAINDVPDLQQDDLGGTLKQLQLHGGREAVSFQTGMEQNHY